MFYLADILTKREYAGETRLFGLAGFLLTRWRAAYDRRISDVVRVVRRAAVRSCAGAAAGQLVGLANVLFVVALYADRQMSVGSAAVLLLGLNQLTASMVALGSAIGGLYEHVLGFADFRRFVSNS